MDREKVIEKTSDYVRKKLENDSTGHDWWHIDRVRKTAVHLAKEEGADMFVVELAALLHDIADWKFYDGDDSIGPIFAKEWLESLGVDENIIAHVCNIIKNISFKGANVENKIDTIEGKIVQDADRLDAIGAIGIARAFAYGGSKNRPIYDPEGKSKGHYSFDEYKKGSDSTVHHFYEKLLLLKERMNTKTGKLLAEERHKVMEQYLEQFYQEWEGKK